jgi:predicted MPP superfamily phosphohydrolase
MESVRRGSVASIVSSFHRLPEQGAMLVHVPPANGGPAATEHRARRRELDLGKRPTVRRFEVVSPRIDPRHDGVTVAHLTDLHLRGNRSARPLRHAVQVLNEIEPDLVVLTGDYVRYSERALPFLASVLAKLEPRKVATLGNHDHWLDADAVCFSLTYGGCQVLRNQHLTIELRGAPLHVVGIDDRLTAHDDARAAFAGVPTSGTCVALSHIPEVAEDLVAYRAALVLSGHTHGGQVRIPRLTVKILEKLGRRYVSGFYPMGEQLLYVSRGMGASVPIRIGAPSEVAVFVLRGSP